MAPTALQDETRIAAEKAAIAGDRLALERLLLAHYDELARCVAAKLPPRLKSTHAVEDILQVTFCQVFRDITSFKQRDNATFVGWLVKIAEHRLLDAIKRHDGPQRGGDRLRVNSAVAEESRVLPLLDWLAADEPSPSSKVARGEALEALQVAIASLAPDQRAAIQLRLLDGKSLEEAATALGRTPDAVRGLVHRGKQELQAAMGRASQWLGAK